MSAMLSSCIQRWRGDPMSRNENQTCDIESLSLSESSECGTDRPAERRKFWQRRSSHLTAAIFFCLAVRVPINSLTDFTFLILVNGHGQALRDTGFFVSEEYVDWPPKGQAMARGLYRYAVPMAEIVGGVAAAQRGRPCLFGAGAATTSLMVLLSPALLHAGAVALSSLLLLARLADALLVHNLELVWGRWVPVDKKWLIAVCYSSIIWGDLVAGVMLQWIPYLLFCPALYYILGCTGLLMCIVWWVAVWRVEAESSVHLRSTPGKKIGFCRLVMSLPVLALIAAVKGNIWSVFTVEIIVPNFFLREGGNTSEMLLLGQRLMSVLVLYSFIFITTTEEVSTKVVRKSCVCVSLAVNGGLLFLLLNINSLKWIAAVTTTVQICSAVAYNSSIVNVFDIAPKFSPIIIGILSAIVSACAALVPSVVQFMTQEETTEEWNKVIYISGGVALAGSLAFLLFGSVKLQKWAAEEDDKQLQCVQET